MDHSRIILIAVLLAAAWWPPLQAADAKQPLPFTLDPAPSTYQPLPRRDVLISGVTLLDGSGQRLDNADVLLRDGKIARVGQQLQVDDSVARLQAPGRWLTPGIIDIHSHDGTYVLPLTSQDFAISDLSEISRPNAAQTWIEHGVNVQDMAFSRALAGGVTTLQILPGSVPLFGGRSVVVKTIPASTVQQMKFPGAPQGMKMACGENPKSHFGEQGDTPTSRMGSVAEMRTAWMQAQGYRQQWLDYQASRKATDPPARDLALDTLAGVLQGEINVHLHCYRADDMAVMLNLAAEFGYHISAFHHATEAYKITPLLRQANSCAAVWSDWWGYKLEADDAIRANAAMLETAGVCTIMHSDSPVIGQRLNIEASKAMGAGRRAGLDVTPEQAIQWITANPARALGLHDRIGRVAEGFNADVVLWSGNPFSIYSHAQQVYVDGALAYDRDQPGLQPRRDTELGLPLAEVQP